MATEAGVLIPIVKGECGAVVVIRWGWIVIVRLRWKSKSWSGKHYGDRWSMGKLAGKDPLERYRKIIKVKLA